MAGLDAFGFRPILPVVFIPAKFVYWVAALCGLYLSIAPFFTSIHDSITSFRVGLWMIGIVFLLIAALLPLRSKYSYIDVTIRDSYRVVGTAAVFAFLGSTLTTVLLLYGVARIVAFRLGYVRGRVQVAVFQPTMFDRLNLIISKPVLLLFFISSVASLVISAVVTLRLRNRTGSPPLVPGNQ